MASAGGQLTGDESDGLRTAIGRARRPYRWAIAAFLVLAILLPILLSLFLPAVAGSAIGLTERVPAVVQAVSGEPRGDQPDKKVTWSVTVEWTDAQGTARRAAENVSAVQAPYRVGEQVDVGVLGDHMTLRPGSDAGWMLALFVGFTAVCLVVAFLYWRRSRAWVSLSALVAAGGPDRSFVVDGGSPLRRRPSRHLPLETGLLLPIRGSGAPSGAVFVLDRVAGSSSGPRMPQSDDQLQIWDGDRASAVHRPADGSWWVTGVDSRDIDLATRGERRLSASAKRIVIPLVALGAIAVAVARLLRADGLGPMGWSLLAAGLALLVGALVVMNRDRRRSRERTVDKQQSLTD